MSESVTGNIYCDGFMDRGHYYRNYTVDCADCGAEQFLAQVGRHLRSKTVARELGWVMGSDGKWRCPKCSEIPARPAE